MTVCAITARYPGDIEIAKDDAIKAIELADKVKQKVCQVLENDAKET